jgi:hypothetical protein
MSVEEEGTTRSKQSEVARVRVGAPSSADCDTSHSTEALYAS